jgi:hypothetical protein
MMPIEHHQYAWRRQMACELRPAQNGQSPSVVAMHIRRRTETGDRLELVNRDKWMEWVQCHDSESYGCPVSATSNVVAMELSDDRFELVDKSLVSIAVWRTPTNLLLFYVARVPGGRKAAA